MTVPGEFSSISTDQWIQSIQKELKERSWNDQFIQLTAGLKAPPAYHKEECQHLKWSPLDGHYSKQAMSGINFKDKDLGNSNKHLLRALKHGLQAPGILKTQKEQPNPESIFKDIHPEMVEWHLFDYKKDDLLVDFLETSGVAYILHPAPPLTTDVHKRFESFIDRLYAFDQSKKAKTFCYHCRVDSSYLTEIAVLRAMRRIFENYRLARGLETVDFCLSTTNSVNPLAEDLYTQMIANSSMTMSAMIAGADRVSLDVFFEGKQDLQYRMAINLIQILKMESHLDKVRDPLCGSYWIEKATDTLAAHYWQSFQSRY